MGRKNQQTQGDAMVAVALIDATTKLLTDPLISSLYAWFWIQRKSGLGFDDRALLRAGVIDINAARAKVDNSIVMQALDKTTSLAGDLAKGLGMAKGGAAGLLAGAATETISKKKSRSIDSMSNEEIAAYLDSRVGGI